MDAETDKEPEIARLRRMLAQPWMEPKTDIIRRRIFTLEFDIIFTNPFEEVDERLYNIGGRK